MIDEYKTMNNALKLFLDKNIVVNKYMVFIKLAAYLLLLCFVLVYAQQIIHGGHPFKTGDWLINYEGGWIRRGLIGQILYEISGFGFSLLWCVFIVQVLIYFSTAHLVLKLFFATAREASWLFFIFSPAFIFLFPFYDTNGGFRKEIIIFLSFCLLAVGLLHGRLNQRYLAASLIVYIVAVFSHEISVFCLIFPLYLLFKSTKSNPTLRGIGRAYIAGFIIASAAGFMLSVFHSGGIEASNLICDSLKNRDLNKDICAGAIKWLGFDAIYALNAVADNIALYVLVYTPLLILAAIPLFLTNWWRGRLPLIIWGFVSLIPLFFIALDWGRLIHIYVTMIFVSFLFDSCNEEIVIQKYPLIAVLIYSSFWSIPHWCPSRAPLGIFELSYRVMQKLHY